MNLSNALSSLSLRSPAQFRCQALLAVGALAACLVAAPAPATAADVAAAEPAAGTLVGIDARGLPVYRLPTVNVTIDRKAALAILAQDSPAARPRKTNTTTAALAARSGAMSETRCSNGRSC